MRSSAFTTACGWTLALALLVLTGFHLGYHAAPAPAPSSAEPTFLYPRDEDGEQIYLSRCMSCHQMNGQGISGVFPPLDGSDWVTGDKGRLIRLVLHGMSGEVEVQGVTYSGAMPPWKDFLDDEQMAAMLTYIRTSWSNDADEVSTEEVAAVRAATADRSDPWTQEELSEEANQGIPGTETEATDGQSPRR